MKNLLCALLITLTTFSCVAAQDDGYKKGELYIGYSNGQIDTGLGDFEDDGLGLDLGDRETFHGFEAAGVFNVSRYFGLKADVSGVYSNRGFAFNVPTPTGTGSIAFETKSSLYNFLGGVQIKNNSNSGRFKPFVHALVGAAHTRIKVSGLGCSVGVDCTGIEGGSETNFAGAFGGGLDIRLSRRVQLRAFQVDYNPVFFDGGRQNNIRLGFGLVF